MSEFAYTRPIVQDPVTKHFVEADFEVLTVSAGSHAVGQAIREGRASRLIVDSSDWVANNGISFLLDHIDYVEDLTVAGPADIKDWSPVSSLTALQSLTVGSGLSKINGIQFEKLKALRVLSWSGRNVDPVSAATGLEELLLGNAKLSDLLPLRGLGKLRRLVLGETTIKSLDGIGELRSLQSLRITRGQLKSLNGIGGTKVDDLSLIRCGKLEDISALGELKSLRTLRLDGCKKITDQLDVVGGCTKLEKCWLEDLGTLPSLDFLLPGKSLRLVDWCGDVRIKNGEMGVLLDLPSLTDVDFPDRKHHSHRCFEIKDLLKARTS